MHTDPDPAAAPPGHRSLVPLHVCTFVLDRKKQVSVIPVYSIVLSPVPGRLPGPADCILSPPPHSASHEGALPPMPSHARALSVFPNYRGRKTPDFIHLPPFSPFLFFER